MLQRHERALQCARDALNDARDQFVFENTPSRAPLILRPGDKVWVNTEAQVPTELPRRWAQDQEQIRRPLHVHQEGQQRQLQD